MNITSSTSPKGAIANTRLLLDTSQRDAAWHELAVTEIEKLGKHVIEARLDLEQTQDPEARQFISHLMKELLSAHTDLEQVLLANESKTRLQGSSGNVTIQWKPPESNNPSSQSSLIDRLLSDEQDPVTARQIYDKVSEILTRDEQIQYLAVQKPLISMTPDAVILTNRRLIVYRPKFLGGVNFEDYIWRDLYDMKLDEGIMTSTITTKTMRRTILALNNLPKIQARKLYSYGQEMEERVREERRMREMEERRAAAGGINIHGITPFQNSSTTPAPYIQPEPVTLPAPIEKEDPFAILKKLKMMLSEDLITQAEYDAKKADLLGRM